MKQSILFTKTRKEDPKDEISKNAQLLIRAGYIHKEMAGVYAYLPLGLRVIKKIENIIREEMDSIGGQELSMTALQNPEVWKKTDRWDDKKMDIWFKSKLATGADIGIACTHEEPITEVLAEYVSSYKDLPKYVYQFQVKFRNELRAKSGIMRVREFLMKDLYSFSINEDEFRKFYEKCADAYERIFNRVGIGEYTFRTLAAGGSFTAGFTDEFQTLSSAGEDIIFVDKNKKIAINKEIYTDENILSLGLKKEDLVEEKSIEVGNIFPLGTKYSDAAGLKIKDENGNEKSVIMGSYGIGLGRLMGAVVEVLSDNKGIVWPESIAPFKVHIISIGSEDNVKEESEKLYKKLSDQKIDVLWDERDLRPGEKFADSDLIGIPYRVVISAKTIKENVYEVKGRTEDTASIMTEDEFFAKVA